MRMPPLLISLSAFPVAWLHNSGLTGLAKGRLASRFWFGSVHSIRIHLVVLDSCCRPQDCLPIYSRAVVSIAWSLILNISAKVPSARPGDLGKSFWMACTTHLALAHPLHMLTRWTLRYNDGHSMKLPLHHSD
jgi:hypothetical protein